MIKSMFCQCPTSAQSSNTVSSCKSNLNYFLISLMIILFQYGSSCIPWRKREGKSCHLLPGPLSGPEMSRNLGLWELGTELQVPRTRKLASSLPRLSTTQELGGLLVASALYRHSQTTATWSKMLGGYKVESDTADTRLTAQGWCKARKRKINSGASLPPFKHCSSSY